MPVPTPSSANLPTESVTAGVETLTESYTVEREQADDDGQYGTQRSYQAVGERQLYLYVDTQTVSTTAVGETTEQILRGYAKVSTDIQADDRVDYGGQTYEFDDPIPKPSGTPTVLELTAQRVS